MKADQILTKRVAIVFFVVMLPLGAQAQSVGAGGGISGTTGSRAAGTNNSGGARSGVSGGGRVNDPANTGGTHRAGTTSSDFGTTDARGITENNGVNEPARRNTSPNSMTNPTNSLNWRSRPGTTGVVNSRNSTLSGVTGNNPTGAVNTPGLQNLRTVIGPISSSTVLFGQLDINRDGTISGTEFAGLNGALANTGNRSTTSTRGTTAPGQVPNPPSTATIPGASNSTATIPGMADSSATIPKGANGQTVTGSEATGTAGLSAAGSAALFQQFDTNRDGVLSGDEFSRMSAAVNQSNAGPGNSR